MPYLLIAHSRHALRIGRQVVATRDGALCVADPAAAPDALVVVDVGPGGAATAARLSAAIELTIDGAVPGDAPVPLAHGAKIDISGTRLVFGDDDATGETEKRAGITDEMAGTLDEPLPAEPTTDAGGRVVALSDGRAWEIPDEGLEIGRDPNCDLVLWSSGASRWHASIAPTLHRPAPPAAGGASPSATTGSSAPGETPPAADALPLLATLEILNPGLLHGRRFRIEHPLAHVGRGTHNEIVLGDESVSGSHATLRHRGDAWVVSDQGSTNGTYVDGERVAGERALPGACELRFGGIKTLFRPIAGAPPAGDSTRGIVGVACGGDG